MRFVALGVAAILGATLCTAAAPAQTPPPGCTLTGSSGLMPQAPGDVSIGCTGLSDALGRQLFDVLNRIVQERLDPQSLMAKLGEVDRIAEAGVPRAVTQHQQQQIIKALLGKPAAQVAINAHPQVEDSAPLAQELAMALAMVGWRVEGDQIRRRATRELDAVPGIALFVKDRNAPPQTAQQLKAALATASIGSSLVSNPSLAPDAVMLWIGRRPELASPDPQPK
jgi:hypothetical protein